MTDERPAGLGTKLCLRKTCNADPPADRCHELLTYEPHGWSTCRAGHVWSPTMQRIRISPHDWQPYRPVDGGAVPWELELLWFFVQLELRARELRLTTDRAGEEWHMPLSFIRGLLGAQYLDAWVAAGLIERGARA